MPFIVNISHHSICNIKQLKEKKNPEITESEKKERKENTCTVIETLKKLIIRLIL